MRQFIKTRLRRALVGIPLVVALLAMSVSLSGCKSLFDKQPATRAAAPAPRVPTGAEKFAAASDTLSTSLEAATRAFARGSSDATAIAAVRSFAADLPKLDKGVAADFAKTRKILSKVKSPDKDAIQARVERTYAERKAALASRLAAVTSAETTAALKSSIAATAEYLASITPEKPYQPLGTSLPHRIVDAKAGPPVLGTAIAPAYAPDTPGATPSTLPVTPTPADTTQTVEVQFTPEIVSLVASLSSDPVRMYEYVRNTIDFEPYYGSRKGATETLLEGSGNDIDTASLLIALYRKAGIPARYVSGVVDVPIEKAMNWVGVETPESAAKLFSAGGTPTKLIISGGKPKALQIEHTWAEVYVDYEDYRGAGAGGSGEKVWVPLDGSFKEYESSDLVSRIRGAIDITSTVRPLSLSVEGTESAVCSLDATRADAVFARISQEATAFAESQAYSARPLRFGRSILGSSPRVLPSALSLHSTANAEWLGVPTELAETLVVDLGGESRTLTVAALRDGLLNLVFAYATDSDAEMAVRAGALSSIAPYLVQVRPTLIISSETVLVGKPITMGNPTVCQVSLQTPGAGVQRIANSITSAGQYSVMVDRGRVPLSRLDASRRRIEADTAALQASGSTEDHLHAAQDLNATMLDVPLQLYFAEAQAARARCSAALGISTFGLTSVGMTGLDLGTSSVLGQPARLTPDGLYIDVDGLNSVAVSGNGDDRALLPYGLAFGAIASAAESSVWDSLYPGLPPASSTAKVFSDSMRAGIPLVYVDPAASEKGLSRLTYSTALKRQLKQETDSGFAVVIPASPLTDGPSPQVGYVVVDPTTGSSGFMISKEYAGGEKDFPNQGEWLAVQTWWDSAGGYAALLASVGLSDAALRLLNVALALPSLAMTMMSYVSFIKWMMEYPLPDVTRIEYITRATMIFLGIVAGSVALSSVSAAVLAPQVAIVAQLAVGFVGTLTFSVLLPLEVEIRAQSVGLGRG